jgi:hypothetical protein
MTGAVLAQAVGEGLPWFVVVPSVVMFALVVIAAPVWPYSRGWGWSIAGMGAVGMFVALLFTLAWVVS